MNHAYVSWATGHVNFGFEVQLTFPSISRALASLRPAPSSDACRLYNESRSDSCPDDEKRDACAPATVAPPH